MTKAEIKSKEVTDKVCEISYLLMHRHAQERDALNATIENLASQIVELQAELTRLKEENSMLLERINNE